MNKQQFIWQDRYNLGVEIIDREHRKLFTILNKLFTYDPNDPKSRWAYQEGIKFFKGHATKHFAEEEVYMASIGYEGYEMHRRLHDTFRKKTLPEIEKELKAKHYSPDAVDHFLGVCAGWLLGHTLMEDRAITGKTASKWSDLMSEDDQKAMQKTIIRLLYDLFRLDSQLISDSYNGEKFGKGIYYRLLYGSEKGEKWEFFLVFEEKLIMDTVGNAVAKDSKDLNAMMLNATRYTARQFLERIMSYLPSAEPLDIKEENLLSYSQFQTIFDRNNPQCSLLFDTGKGYFAYCMMAPHLLEDASAPFIKAENAMEEITKYLQNKEADNRPKILIVDDSAVMLQAMKQLFDEDYEVLTAKSGVSAIRSMTLNRPDLVLLDYEMPVCDGKQILQMIRAEEEFNDMPVMFLTGNTDKERIRELIPLKPAGYLLKSMRPQDIKSNVDDYFKKEQS